MQGAVQRSGESVTGISWFIRLVAGLACADAVRINTQVTLITYINEYLIVEIENYFQQHVNLRYRSAEASAERVNDVFRK